MDWIDIFLSHRRWYRQWRKGVWYRVIGPQITGYADFWVREPIECERVVDREEY